MLCVYKDKESLQLNNKKRNDPMGGGELNRYFTKKYMEITNEIFPLL